jgi:hypothetical protein
MSILLFARRARAIGAACCALLLHAPAASAQPMVGAPTLGRAHAHNDYQHARPLLDALERGYASIEADVWLASGASGQLLVAHARDSVVADRTLERLYLAPLRDAIARGGGRLHADGTPLLLLIDVKSDAESTYVALDALLRRYDDVVTSYADGRIVARPVLAVVSGNRAIGTVRTARERFVALDGRLADLATGASSPPPTVMPLVSEGWDKVTTWQGAGPPPSAVRTAVARAVARAHAQGRRLRFWGTPDDERVWRFLYDAGVDLLNADDLDRLRTFLERQR